jgi:hypothetical protein
LSQENYCCHLPGKKNVFLHLHVLKKEQSN